MFENKAQKQKGQMVSDKMVNQNKTYSFKIKRQAKNIFPRDVERTVAIFAYDNSGLLTTDHVPVGETVNGEYYSNFLRKKMRPAMRKKTPSAIKSRTDTAARQRNTT